MYDLMIFAAMEKGKAMPRLIDADEAKRFAKECWPNPTQRIAIDAILDNAPTVDAVKVVRCRECKFFTEGMAIGMCKRIPDKPIIPVAYNHYCSYGEKRPCRD